MAYQPIENYGIIGDLYTVALVGMDGSIDFMSYPHFDSPTVFAALLDHQKGGHFRIAPVLEDARHKQMYLPDSNILITRFLSREGVAEVSDFMPVEEAGQAPAHNLVRRAKTVRGEVLSMTIISMISAGGKCREMVVRGRTSVTHCKNFGLARKFLLNPLLIGVFESIFAN
jgi:GH15 family glucan-1,4-alpha-glucosidase